MRRPRQFTIAGAMVAVAAAGVACAGVLMIKTGWEPFAYFVERRITELGSWACFAIAFAMIILGPFLLAGLGLLLFPIRADKPSRADGSANPDIDEP